MGLISIFNGRSRSLGKNESKIYLQVSVELRKYLFKFKKARLSVFICIALHSEEDGWTPGIPVPQIMEETGFSKDTVETALRELCELTIEDERVLYKQQDKQTGNRYLIFPTKEELEKLEAMGENLTLRIGEKIALPMGENLALPKGEKTDHQIGENLALPIKDRETKKEDLKEKTHTDENESGVCVPEKWKSFFEKIKRANYRSEHSPQTILAHAEAKGLGDGWIIEAVKTGLYDPLILIMEEPQKSKNSDKPNAKKSQLTFTEAAQRVASLSSIPTDKLSQYISELEVSDETREKLREKFLKEEVSPL